MYMQFFIPMQPPTTTHNAKQLHAYMKGGQPHAVLHDSPELKAARAKLHAYLAPHAPKAPIPAGQPVRLLVKWCFPTEGKRRSGEWRTSKPDTDNLEKALKDEMTRLHFWADDAQVCSEIVEKFWSDLRGVRPGGGAGMTYEEKRRWLSRYGDAMVKAKHLRDDLDEAERDTGCTTQQLTGMPGGSGDGRVWHEL